MDMASVGTALSRWVGVTFALIVVLPTALYAAYLLAFASDIYECEMKFAVRGQTQRLMGADAAGGPMTGALVAMNGTQEANIVFNYIRSSGIVADLEKGEKLRQLYANPNIDYWSRLSNSAPHERLADYWLGMTEARIEAISGIITLKIRAYTPESAVAISKGVLALSDSLVNRMTGQLRDDTVLLAEQEVRRASERIAETQKKLLQFRSQESSIDANKSAKSIFDAIVKLREARLAAEIGLQSGLTSMSPDAPAIRELKQRVASINAQIQDNQDKLTNARGGDERTASQAIQGYEALRIDADFANDALVAAENMLATARNDFDAQHVYVETFVPPALPEQPIYPRPFKDSLVLFAKLFVSWMILVLLVEWIKEHGS